MSEFLENVTDPEVAMGKWKDLYTRNESLYVRANHAYRAKKITKEAYDKEMRGYRTQVERLNRYAKEINAKFGTDLPVKPNSSST